MNDTLRKINQLLQKEGYKGYELNHIGCHTMAEFSKNGGDQIIKVDLISVVESRP